MEVTVKFRNSMIETHRLPELAGNTTSYFDERAGIEKGFNDVDAVVDVIERCSLEQDGFVLARFVMKQEGGKLEKLRSSHYTVLPMSRMSEAVSVLVDDEVIWENPECSF